MLYSEQRQHNHSIIVSISNLLTEDGVLLDPHHFQLDLNTLQHPFLDIDILNVLAQHQAMGTFEVILLQDPPHARDLICAERDHVRDAPHERVRIGILWS